MQQNLDNGPLGGVPKVIISNEAPFGAVKTNKDATIPALWYVESVYHPGCNR